MLVSSTKVRVMIVLMGVCLIGALLGPARRADAQAGPTLSTYLVDETADYASENFGDPWDFANEADLPLVPGLNYLRTSNETIANGRLSVDTPGQGMAFLVKSWESGGISWGRDGADYPIDADRFTHATIRMFNSTPVRIQSAIYWFDCGQLRPECQGGSTFNIDPGWHTYTVELDRTIGTVDWAGDQAGFAVVLSSAAAHVDVDWIRVHTAGTDPVVDTGTTSNSTEVFWDADTNAANNTPANPNWGSVGVTTNGKVTFPASAYPAGDYHFYTASNSAYSDPLVINERPRPVVIDPDIEGGADYAATVRGDAWDMNQPGDIAFTANIANGSFANGSFTANNTNDDSQITLSVPAPIDSTRWHRFVANIFFTGDFSLKAEPNGGMNMRIVWRLGNGVYRVSDDIVVTPGWNRVAIDLSELDGTDIEGSYSDTWTTFSPDQLRLDPTEDPAARPFILTDLRLNEDDKGDGLFDIRFEDTAWEPGTTARIYADTNNTGHNGSLIGEVDMTAGVNTYSWVPRVTGTRWIHVEVTDPNGATSRSYSTGPVQVTAAQQSPCAGLTPTHRGTAGDDDIMGTNGDDIIFGLGGNDRIWGLGGDDILCAGPGNDRLFGGSGNNTLYGEQGIDKMRSGGGADTLWGGDSRDYMKGGHGDDVMYGEDGPDLMRASVGDDLVFGGAGNDVLWGGIGNDELYAGPDNDVLKGSAGIDHCDGGPGYDFFKPDCTTTADE